ncbi:AAA family ATPase, partial [Patescibacteria group bacterium]|nr:AAA family ATPase [Patescibacteria group bacterium]
MRLIIINGPCGAGKTKAAQVIHQSLFGSFLIDIDAQRRFISRYRARPQESWEFSMDITKSLIETALRRGRDVIIDKMLYDEEALDGFTKIAENHAAEIHEFILWAEKDIIMQRAEERGFKPGNLLTREKCEFFWNQINTLKDR